MKSVSAEDCVRRDYGTSSFVCVCNATYCDTAPSVGSLTTGQAIQITSTQDAARFKTANLQFGSSSGGFISTKHLFLIIHNYNNDIQAA